MAKEGFGTDPYGIIAAGAPGGRSMGPGISVGGISAPRSVADAPFTVGSPNPMQRGAPSGVGATYTLPLIQAPARKGEVNRGQLKAKGGKVKKMAKGGSTASKRADGCATKGKTKGRFV